jgi:hypothetical protein
MSLFVANAEQLVPYALLLLAYLFLSFQRELARNRLFDVPLLGLLAIFAGFRDAMTPDLERYKEMYESIGSGNSLPLETSFVFLSKILNRLGFDYHALFFMFTLITLLFVYFGIRNYTDNVKLSLLFYTLIPSCFLNLFVEMREACAVSIAFYATSLLNRKNLRFKVPIVVGLAMLSLSFHFSAILYWPILVLAYKFIRKPHSVYLYVSLLIGSLLIPTSALIAVINHFALPFLPARYQGYITLFEDLQLASTESGQVLKTLIYVAIALSFVFWRRSMKSAGEDQVPLNLFVIGVVILELTRSLAAASRLSYFFLIYQIVIFPSLLGTVENRTRRFVAAYSVVLFYFAQFAWGLTFYSEEAANYPFLHFQNALFSLFH